MITGVSDSELEEVVWGFDQRAPFSSHTVVHRLSRRSLNAMRVFFIRRCITVLRVLTMSVGATSQCELVVLLMLS